MRISDWSSDVCSSDLYRRQGIEGLLPKPRSDRGQCKLPLAVQQAIVAAKQDNPRRSIRQIRELLEAAGSVAAGSLSRSAIHRLLQQQGLSRIDGSASQLAEKRSFVAEFAGPTWSGRSEARRVGKEGVSTCKS